mmetsp:Transcript_20130/g.61230  ORF Transcript_20130/g.61230 Transcript_20130/m.61230 type:complete len:235 (-) Transcript_20130:756-1460(-)
MGTPACRVTRAPATLRRWTRSCSPASRPSALATLTRPISSGNSFVRWASRCSTETVSGARLAAGASLALAAGVTYTGGTTTARWRWTRSVWSSSLRNAPQPRWRATSPLRTRSGRSSMQWVSTCTIASARGLCAVRAASPHQHLGECQPQPKPWVDMRLTATIHRRGMAPTIPRTLPTRATRRRLATAMVPTVQATMPMLAAPPPGLVTTTRTTTAGGMAKGESATGRASAEQL